MQDIHISTVRRVVVRGTNWVGDAVMTVPALRELRRLLPAAHITLATRPWVQGLFGDADFLDDLLICNRGGVWSLFNQIREWREHRFDLAVVFPNAFEAALIPALARVPIRIGYATDGRKALLTNSLRLPAWRDAKHEIFYYLNIIAETEHLLTGEQTITEREPDDSLLISEMRRQQGLSLLRSLGLRGAGPTVALCPGSINSRAKRWPVDRYAALADRLTDELRAEVLLIGSKDELDVSLDVARLMRNKPIILTGKTDLGQSAAVLSLVNLLVTNDTGPAHIAAALRRPTLVIFGPTNPLTTRPFSSTAQIMRHPPDCAPCMLRDCPIDHRCMTAITPQQVFDQARLLLHEEVVVGESREALQIQPEGTHEMGWSLRK